jgi:hypothetical protein
MNNPTRRDALQRAAAAGAALAVGAAPAAADEKPAAEHDLKALETKIKGLRDSCTKLNDDKHYDEMLTIIHKPGWTTPAEYLLVRAIVDSMASHTEALGSLQQSLLEGSRMVSAK